MNQLRKHNSQKPPAKLDLRDEIDAALQGDFQFNGCFYCAERLSTASNPCLSIEGAGPVGLPLSERDAKAIIQVAKQAPFGHGTETVIDTKVRDTWELEPQQFKFGNPEWTKFIDSTVVKTVWDGLGVVKPLTTTTPKCELYKLLLYETGSHFLPHQDTEKAAGMFATVVVLLPSPYEGGQVHVTHNSKTEVIDLSSNSHLTTSVLAWYTDVTHEVKEITSGYRLALSYNLIHTSTPETIPHIPQMDNAIAKVRTVLEKWRLPPFKDEDREKNLLAYLLRHQYNNLNLKDGAKALKGQDAHLVAHVRVAAEQAGFLVFLGALQCHLHGYGDDDDYGESDYWGKRSRYDDYGSRNDDDVGFMEVEDTEIDVRNIVDLNGADILGKNVLGLEDENLVQKNPFEGTKPDQREYEGYMGNGAGSLDHWYRRTVLILVHKEDVDEIFLEAGRISYALSKLLSLDKPSEEGRQLLEYLVKNVTPQDVEISRQISNYALQRGSLDTWKTIIQREGNTIATFGVEGLVTALKVFTFEKVRPSFEALLQRPQVLNDRLELVQALQNHVDQEDMTAAATWGEAWSLQVLRSLGSTSPSDIPVLFNAAKHRGISFLLNEIVPQLARSPDLFDALVSFTTLANQKHDEISILADAAAQPVDWDAFMSHCLDILINQCQVIQTYSTQRYDYNAKCLIDGHLKKYLQVIALCIEVRLLGPCNKLCQRLLEISGDVGTKFTSVYRPFLEQFSPLCKKANFDSLTSPFDDLLRQLVASYLHSILGESSKEYLPTIRRLGCGCASCKELDQFIYTPKQTEKSFKLPQAQRNHLEERIRTAHDLVSYDTIRSGSPHTLQVAKQSPIISAQQWEIRLSNAKAFLASIGDDTVIARLMGERYPDVQLALAGTQPFPETQRTAVAVASASSSASPAQGDPVPAQQLAPGTMVQKRKRSESVMDDGIIDLTRRSS